MYTYTQCPLASLPNSKYCISLWIVSQMKTVIPSCFAAIQSKIPGGSSDSKDEDLDLV